MADPRIDTGIFLERNLQHISGDKLRPAMVFVTAFDEYAVDAFELSAHERFEAALDRSPPCEQFRG